MAGRKVSTFVAKLTFALAFKASERDGVVAKVARRIVAWVLHFDFDLDEQVKLDKGYTVEELEAFEAGIGRVPE